jgi:hypothetical protein
MRRFLAGEIDVGGAADELRNEPGFDDQLTRYWLGALKISDQVDVLGISYPGPDAPQGVRTTAALLRQAPGMLTILSSVKASERAADKLTTLLSTARSAQETAGPGVFRRLVYKPAAGASCPMGRYGMRLTSQDADTDRQIREALCTSGCKGKDGRTVDPHSIEVLGDDGAITRLGLTPAQIAAFQAIADYLGLQNCACTAAATVEVHPYWAPQATVRVCKGAGTAGSPASAVTVGHAAYCGEDLSRCFPDTLVEDSGDPGNVYRQEVQTAFALEPARIVARVVQEDRPFDDVLRSTQGLLSGVQRHFLKAFGAILWLVLPPGSYPGLRAQLAAETPAPSAPPAWVERGPLHAGVLTTVGFLRTSNGWRSMANRAQSAFLCREFAVADDVKQVASEQADLTKKPYCQNCHAVLEPLAQFFGRWPNLGNDSNYYYNASPAVSAVGAYGGMTDGDTVGLARVLTAQRDFDACAVKRAFDFVVGRPMTSDEAAQLLEPLTAELAANGRRVWPIMRRIIETPAFLGGPTDVAAEGAP